MNVIYKDPTGLIEIYNTKCVVRLGFFIFQTFAHQPELAMRIKEHFLEAPCNQANPGLMLIPSTSEETKPYGELKA